jgi:hypothetical protein
MCLVPLRQAPYHHVGITYGLHLWREGGGGEERDGGYVGRKKVGRKEWGERKGRKDGWNKSEN